MRQMGEYRLGAPRQRVWTALNDPEVLAASIDGCQSLTKTADDAFEAVVRARIGPVSAPFTAEVKLADVVAPESYRLIVNAKGGAAGFGKGEARVTLAEEGAATVLAYEVEGQVGGKLAQVGQRLIDAAARKMADDFFARFGEAVAPGASEKTTPAAPTGPGRAGIAPWIALAVAAVLAALAALVLRR
ncbi:MAG TPA: carbon monoxide dehydrogenase subunit G [Caulobacteraceae bacterium]|nr:carbon monoxide dehydrogenase subunit G [Caulobacteraceae bacterium]